jgi:hypothetical protein
MAKRTKKGLIGRAQAQLLRAAKAAATAAATAATETVMKEILKSFEESKGKPAKGKKAPAARKTTKRIASRKKRT